MILESTLKSAYNRFYAEMRKYLWNMDTVEKLVDLEIAIYKAVPNMGRVKSAFTTLYMDIKETLRDDEDFRKVTESLRDIINSGNESAARLVKVQEVIRL